MTSSVAIQAITFDLWDTIVADDSDEAHRTARGLLSKHDARRASVYEILAEHGPTIHGEVIDAYDGVEHAFRAAWHEKHVTWPVRDRLERVLKALDRTVPASSFDAMVTAHASMEVDVPPDLIPGAAEVLELLSATYPLAIISDAIVSPGTSLRQLLAHHGVLKYFSACVFSDEVGRSKPHASVFHAAADQLDVGVANMIHVGDRERNDVVGAHGVGAQAVLFTATRSTDLEGTTADAVCERYPDLPGIIASLAGA